MFRRTLVVLFSLVIAANLAACTQAPTPEVANTYITPPEGMEGFGLAPDEQGAPSNTYNSIAPRSAPVDTSGFTRPAHMSGINVMGDDEYVVVMINIAEADWPSFAEQVGIEKGLLPGVVAIKGETVSSLIDLDAVAEEFLQSREEFGQTPLDIRTMEVYFDLFVLEN